MVAVGYIILPVFDVFHDCDSWWSQVLLSPWVCRCLSSFECLQVFFRDYKISMHGMVYSVYLAVQHMYAKLAIV